MLEVMSRNWWVFLIRGIAAVLFGIVLLLWPSIALTSLVFLWGAYAVVDGIFAIVAGIQGSAEVSNRWLAVLQGVVGIIAGVVAIMWPEITATALLYVVAIWAIFTGILEFIAAIQLRKEITDEFWMGLSGVLSIVFGALLIIYPSSGMLALLWMLGIYAIVSGVATILLSFRLRGETHQGDSQQHPRAV